MSECLTREQWYETSTFPSGDHFLKQTVVIEGVTGAEIRKWVNLIPSRCGHFLTKEQIKAKGFPPDILDSLVKAGMVEKTSNSFHDHIVTLTDFGRDLKRAVWCPNFRIMRTNVPQILEKVRVAVRIMNEQHSCHISEIWLFGSYVSSSNQFLSDIDVAFDCVRKQNLSFEQIRQLKKMLPRCVHLTAHYSNEQQWNLGDRTRIKID